MTGNLLRASEASLSSATADAQAKGARIADLEKEIATAQEALKDALTQLKVCRLLCSNPSLPIHKLLPPLRVATIYPQVKFEDNQSLEKRVAELVEQYNTLRAEHEASTAARLEELATAKAELDTGAHPNKLSPLTIDEPLRSRSVHPHLRPLVQSLSASEYVYVLCVHMRVHTLSFHRCAQLTSTSQPSRSSASSKTKT